MGEDMTTIIESIKEVGSLSLIKPDSVCLTDDVLDRMTSFNSPKTEQEYIEKHIGVCTMCRGKLADSWESKRPSNIIKIKDYQK